ncbi:MAG: SCP2 sterol-binding domain-containing protein [Polyangiales bacterium]
MTVRPIQFLRDDFPRLFNRGVEVLQTRASGGDEQAQRILADVQGVTGAARLEVQGEPPIVLSAAEGSLTAGDAPPAGVPLKVSAKIPGDAVQLLLGEALQAGALENDEVAVGAAQTASKRFEDALAGRPMTLSAKVKGVPDLGDVVLQVAFNVPEIPDTPGFTTEVDFTDLDAARRGELTVQELFLGGKLKMEGDYSMALQISMQLLTNPL